MTSSEVPRPPLNDLPAGRPRWAKLVSIAAVAAVLGTGSVCAYNKFTDTPMSEAIQSSQTVRNTSDLLQADRINLPGAHLEDDGLYIEPMPFAIVNQDGSGGQPNEPVNLYGTHLKATGDFTVQADMESARDGAVFSLYGQTPVIYDEFRYERNTLRLAMRGDTLTVQAWKHESQQPNSYHYQIAETDSRRLTITRQGDRLRLAVNGQAVAELPEDGLFKEGNIWFGAAAEKQPWLLTKLQAKQVNGAFLEIVDSTQPNVLAKTNPDGLQQLINKRRPGFLLGTAVALGPLTSDPEYIDVVQRQGNFGVLTTENALKRQFTEPVPGAYDFTEADAIFDLAGRYGQKVKIHPLVFGEANPAWLQNLPTGTPAANAQVEHYMTDYITTVLQRYGSRASSVDVVNEPLADYDGFEEGQMLRDHIFYKAMGKEYIFKAFRAARAATAGMKNPPKLGVNEFGWEEDGERWDFGFSLVKELAAQGLIDYVGFQSHVYESEDRIDFKVLRRHMQQMADIGVDSQISEMDVYSDDGTKVQAQQYSGGLALCLSMPSCTAFTNWIPSDRYNMWRDDDGRLQFGQDGLYDRNLQPTPAVDAMRQVILAR